jgi:hypothetical protein
VLVTVTTTLRPTMLYTPPNNPCEKRPDRSSPTRVAPFSLATLLALAVAPRSPRSPPEYDGLRGAGKEYQV